MPQTKIVKAKRGQTFMHPKDGAFKFIQVTKKGFNFMHLETLRMKFADPVYDKGSSFKSLPQGNHHVFSVEVSYEWARELQDSPELDKATVMLFPPISDKLEFPIPEGYEVSVSPTNVKFVRRHRVPKLVYYMTRDVEIHQLADSEGYEDLKASGWNFRKVCGYSNMDLIKGTSKDGHERIYIGHWNDGDLRDGN